MSLRMNVYGWNQAAFERTLGSGDARVLEDATARLRKSFPKDEQFGPAQGWLQRLVRSGFPMRKDRGVPALPADGSLLAMQMETEIHAIVVHCITQSIATEQHLDLTEKSSMWSLPAVGALSRELSACGFTRTKECGWKYVEWISRLSNGSPLFGDQFCTSWSYYTLFANDELADIIKFFQAASNYKRTLPPSWPEEQTKRLILELSIDGKRFVGDLIKWLGAIHQLGQDVFILWW